ncbi:hypothetical protein B296_00047141, partial [Ensete ventricosum]
KVDDLEEEEEEEEAKGEEAEEWWGEEKGAAPAAAAGQADRRRGLEIGGTVELDLLEDLLAIRVIDVLERRLANLANLKEALGMVFIPEARGVKRNGGELGLTEGSGFLTAKESYGTAVMADVNGFCLLGSTKAGR